MFTNDPHIMAVLNKELVVPESLGFPDMTTDEVGKNTFMFLRSLSEY